MKRSEAGSGGRLGRSNMTHWDIALHVKAQANKDRRINDRLAIGEFVPEPNLDEDAYLAVAEERWIEGQLESAADAILAEDDVNHAHAEALAFLAELEAEYTHAVLFAGVDLPTWGTTFDPEELQWGFSVTTRP
jgi:hypothetical protein